MGDRFTALRKSVEADALSAAIARAGGRRYRLTQLAVASTYPVFRGEADGVPPVFVKVASEEAWRRTAHLLKQVGSSRFLANFAFSEPIEYLGLAVFVLEWQAASVVYPEDMTASEAEGFVREYVRFAETLRAVTGVPSADELPEAPETLYDTLRAYAARHPIAARALGGLLDLPVGARTFGSRPRVVVHGDFHAKNFGFFADGRMAVCDFDKVMTGLACGDLANALVERFSCLSLPKEVRCRLATVTRRIVAASPWPREDFEIMGNVLRLTFAARRIRKHPDAAWVAFDIRRRDRKICEFLDCLGDGEKSAENRETPVLSYHPLRTKIMI